MKTFLGVCIIVPLVILASPFLLWEALTKSEEDKEAEREYAYEVWQESLFGGK